MKKGIPFFFLSLIFICFSLFAEEPFIDLRTFVEERTQQYPFQGGEKIYLNTPSRTGSTLVYNVLRYLFERKDQQPFDNQEWNLVVKFHEPTLFDPRATYICTIRDPVEASLSFYRALSNAKGALLPLSSLNGIVDRLVDAFNYIDGLHARGFPCLVLRYEEFVNDFESLFRSIEKQYALVIDPKDRAFLKKALSRRNVNKNIEKFPSFSEYDGYSNLHGNHIHQGEPSEAYLLLIKSAILSRLREHAALFQRWGYDINP